MLCNTRVLMVCVGRQKRERYQQNWCGMHHESMSVEYLRKTFSLKTLHLLLIQSGVRSVTSHQEFVFFKKGTVKHTFFLLTAPSSISLHFLQKFAAFVFQRLLEFTRNRKDLSDRWSSGIRNWRLAGGKGLETVKGCVFF